MKNYSIFLLLFFSALTLHAQDYQISFVGTGASTKVDSVKVENLTQRKRITIVGSEVLHLVETVTGINQSFERENTFRIYPNPMTDNTTIDFVATAPGTATIEVFETNGKIVGKTQNIFAIGAHSFNVSGLCRGIYTVKINSNAYTYTGKLISKGKHGSDLKMSYNGYGEMQAKSPKLKSTNVEKEMQYTTGDRLIITGKSGNYSTVFVDVPTQSKTISFNFVACTDADGNNYPVVQIGKQLWMAENLKTTKYRNGDPIPNVTVNNYWHNLSTGAYCNYDNKPGNSATYGKLYNFYAVDDSRNIAPIGWHVPTDEEWIKLENFLYFNFGAMGADAKKLASTTNWATSAKIDAIGNDRTKNNSTGFTALPGGMRSSNYGSFDYIGKYGSWWSSTEYSESHAYSRYLGYDFEDLGRDSSHSKEYGYSVRCLRDN